jgi:hypothetical protein
VTIPTLPNGGDFDVTFGASVANNVSVAVIWNVGLDVGGTVTYYASFAAQGSGSSVTTGTSLSETVRLTGLSSATLIKVQYSISGTGTNYQDRFLQVTPVRVG